MIEWLSAKLGRVYMSVIGAEILAAAKSADRGSMISESISLSFGLESALLYILSVDSHGLHRTITTLHDGPYYCLISTVARMRYSFENCGITTLQWFIGVVNLANSLTKRNLYLQKKLNG